MTPPRRPFAGPLTAATPWLLAAALLSACRGPAVPAPPAVATLDGSAATAIPANSAAAPAEGTSTPAPPAEPGPPAPDRPALVASVPALPPTDAVTCGRLQDALTQVQPYLGQSIDVEPFLADLASADVRVRASALGRVEGVGAESIALIDPLLSIAGAGDANARLRALELLTRIDAARAIAASSELLATEGGRQVRAIAATSLARSGDSGLAALLAALGGDDEAVRRDVYAALPRAAAYPIAALRRLFGTAAPCAQLEHEGCRELARALVVGDPVALREALGDSPVLELLVTEAQADADPDALARWGALVADPAVPVGHVRDSVIELRLRGVTTGLAPGLRRLLDEPAVLGPRTVGGLLAVAGTLLDAGPALERCASTAENLDVAATCAATRAAIGPWTPGEPELARLESILAQSAPAHALSGRLAAMVLAVTGAMREDSAWVARFDEPTRTLLVALAAGDAARIATAINDPALDDRTAIRAGVLFATSRGSALADAFGGLAPALGSDARWLEIAAASGAAWEPHAEPLAAALDAAQPSAGALRWLHAAGQTERVADWVERALSSGDYARVHVAVLAARGVGLAVDPAHLLGLLTHRGAQARVETAAYRLDIARLLVDQGGVDPGLLLAERARIGDGAPGFPELGLVAMTSLTSCP